MNDLKDLKPYSGQSKNPFDKVAFSLSEARVYMENTQRGRSGRRRRLRSGLVYHGLESIPQKFAYDFFDKLFLSTSQRCCVGQMGCRQVVRENVEFGCRPLGGQGRHYKAAPNVFASKRSAVEKKAPDTGQRHVICHEPVLL